MARIGFEISDGATVYLLHPLARPADVWIIEHLPSDTPRLGDGAAIKWRCVEDVVGGAIANGLRVR
jgi:hypothetical protein